jgi:cleavage and polyadenylation specificity factor subunit 1
VIQLIFTSFEFSPNEFVNALESVTLETLSTESGTKDFIAIGTTINRGEDLAVKGAVSIVHRVLLHFCSD